MKTLKLFSLLVCIMLCGLTANSQIMVKEGSFKRIDGYVMTDKYDHTDMNDAPMALIKISTENINAEQRGKFSFKGNAITYFDVQFKPGEIYLYLSAQAANFIEIIHEDYGKTEFWLPYGLCDFCAYEMVIEYIPKKEEAELIVSGNMDNSLIYIDDRLLGVKEAKKMSEVGATHTWKIECDGYQTESGTVALNGKTEIYKVLKPIMVEESIDGTNKKTKKQNKFFLGVNAGLGGGIHKGHSFVCYSKAITFQFNAGFDMAFPLNKTLSLGLSASAGFEASSAISGIFEHPESSKNDYSVAPLIVFNFRNKGALLLGAGVNIYRHVNSVPLRDSYGFEVGEYDVYPDNIMNIGMTSRIGYLFPNKFYIMGEFIYNNNVVENSCFHSDSPGVPDVYTTYVCRNYACLFHFGYRIF